MLIAGPKTIGAIPDFARHDRTLVVIRSTDRPEEVLARFDDRVVFVGGGPPVWDVYAPFIRHWDVNRLPYDGPAGSFFAKFMAFYNRRLRAMADKRRAKGTYGAWNTGMDLTLGQSYTPDLSAMRFLRWGIRLWLMAEWRTWFGRAPQTGMARESAGTNTNTASGLASRTFCRKGEKSGLANGTRNCSMI